MMGGLIACDQCAGTGAVNVQSTPARLTSASGSYERVTCRACKGSGAGKQTSVAELHSYKREAIAVPEDLFSYAKLVAGRTRRPKSVEFVMTEVVEYTGLFKAKRSTRQVSQQVQHDHWNLHISGATTVHNANDYGGDSCLDAQTEKEYRFTLMGDGSLGCQKRQRDVVVWRGANQKADAWSPWEAHPLSLDDFLMNFDFEAETRFQARDYTVSTLVADAIRLSEWGGSCSVRRNFLKGFGLYYRLKDMDRA